jgi:hypothetical protein
MQELNLAEFSKCYAVSKNLITSASCLPERLKAHNFPEGIVVDFIGPATLHQNAAAALSIGQSFTEEGKVLFINIDHSKTISDFIKKVMEYQASNMLYVEVIDLPPAGRWVDKNDFVLEYTLVNKPHEEKDMNTEKFDLDFDVQEDTGYESNQTMTWDEAKAILKAPTTETDDAKYVRRLAWGPLSFVGYNEGKVLSTEKFWVQQNRMAAARNGGFLTVLPYYTFCDGVSVDMSYRPTSVDEHATDWVVGNMNVFLVDLEREPSGDLWASYNLLPGNIEEGANVLNQCYQMISSKDVSNIAIVTGQSLVGAKQIGALITDMKAKLFGTEATAHTRFGETGLPNNTNLVNAVGFGVDYSADIGREHLLKLKAIETINALAAMVENNPALNIIIDVKGLAENIDYNKFDYHTNNEHAIEFVNILIRGINSDDRFSNTQYVAFDLDAITEDALP